MKKTAYGRSFIFRALPLLLFTALLCIPVLSHAAGSGSKANEGSDQRDNIRIKIYTETGIEYTDNVFRLTESQISKMEANAAEDAENGRFKDMDSVSDYILSPEVGVSLDSDGPLGGDLSLTSRLRYNYYNKNTGSSFPEARVRLRNSLGEKGNLSLEGNFVFDVFKKNYLSGYDDANENGNITRQERAYSPAVYDEYEGIIAYGYELIKGKKEVLSGLDLEPFAGYRTRIYNRDFRNRDQDINFIGLNLDLEFVSRIGLEVTYLYEEVESPGNRELVLFDETLSGEDVNNDGEVKGNAPLVTLIDRSSTRHTFEITPSFKITGDTRAFIGYEKRTTECDSSNPLDTGHYNQEEYRSQIKSGIGHDLSKRWSLDAEYTRTDEEEEDGDYTENSYLVKVRYEF